MSYLFGRIVAAVLVFGRVKTLIFFALELLLALHIGFDVGHDVELLLGCCRASVLQGRSLDGAGVQGCLVQRVSANKRRSG